MYYLALCIVYKVYKVVLGALGWPSMQLVAGSSPAGERVQRFIGRAVPSRSKVYTAETGTECERLVGMTCEKEVGS